MASTADILAQLRAAAHPNNLKGMARYGMAVENRLGVSVPDMRRIAKAVGTDHRAALKLWRTGIPEARILASMIADQRELTESQLDAWVKDINSWDVCDQVCMNLFEKSPLARQKIIEWSESEGEFVRRTAFALIACLAWHDKLAMDEEFLRYLPAIRNGATDERNYVKKAVSWALRNIGKRNSGLRKAAIKTAKEIQLLDSRAARSISADAVRELTSR